MAFQKQAWSDSVFHYMGVCWDSMAFWFKLNTEAARGRTAAAR